MLSSKTLKFRAEYPADEKMRGAQNFELSQSLLKCHSSLISNSMTSTDEVAKTRKISSNPYRVLEAPGLCDDFYLNLVDWSSQNILGVALDNIVYVWNATTSTV